MLSTISTGCHTITLKIKVESNVNAFKTLAPVYSCSLLFSALTPVIHGHFSPIYYPLPLHRLFFLSKMTFPLLSYSSLKI